MQVFEFKTGRFTPLSDDVLAKFNDEQRTAYDQLASAVARLDGANAEAANAIAENRAAVTALHDAEAAEAKGPKHTFMDELRASQQQWRKDHQ
jgi:hypothetical protein